MASESESEPKASRPSARYRYFLREADYRPQLNGQDDFTALETVEMAKDTASHLQQLYDQGVPFFSKNVFRDIVTQLDACRANPNPATPHVISIPAINGTVIKFELETGTVTRTYHDDTDDEDNKEDMEDIESVLGNPYLHYHAINHLNQHDRLLYMAKPTAYLPSRLVYPVTLRRISTKEPVTLWEHAPADAVQAALDAGIKAWEATEECKNLRGLFKTAPLQKITKIVAFACCTMGLDGKYIRSIWQHALILTLRDVLEKRPDGTKIQCFAQDPVYTPADKEVLSKAGITVLDDPRGFVEVDDETLVLSIAPNIAVRQIIADIARPAVMIWDRVESEAEEAKWREESGYTGVGTDPESPRLRAMVRDRYCAITGVLPKKAFGSAAVYIRQE